jgi:hypothetical protein
VRIDKNEIVNYINTNTFEKEAIFMKDLICTAVRQKKTVRFSYERASIIAEPFCFGISADGKEVMKGYQVAGGTSGWRLYEIAKVQNLEITKITFGLTRKDFKAEENMKYVKCKAE